ncbi:hypothetical protein C8F01DRAFT_1249886 [Mycena amicta]|nr:hypothetical protein C8F01DRAFT_1249886 [Mycena amicta]
MSVNEISTICVIGAGAAGLAALRALLDTPQVRSGRWRISVFEARSGIGGIWLPDSTRDLPSFQARVENFQREASDLHPQTPLYDSLTTNLPHPVMCFQCFPFPSGSPIFPAAAHVQRYLENYANHFNLMPYIRLNTSVTDVRWDSTQWIVTLQSQSSHRFDRVVIANGHHSVPRYPDIPGLHAWLTAKRLLHSLWYRRPTRLGNKVLVVGGGPSGNDISAELAQVCPTLIRSITGAINEEHDNVKIRGRTVQLGESGQVFFEDGSVESDVDYCILATGYEVSLPFLTLAPGIPPSCPPLPPMLYNSTYHIFPLANHIFPIQSVFPATSLAFMGLPVRVAPLPVMEAQAAAIVRVFEDPTSLDIENESQRILERYSELLAQSGGNTTAIARLWSIFKEEEQFDYQDALFQFAGSEQRVPQWRKDMYAAKGLLRAYWVELSRRGEAEEWVTGVEGMDEWAALMQRLLESAREWESNRKE